MGDKFSELDKVRVRCESGIYEAYVIGMTVKDGQKIYKLSVIEDSETTFDNWAPEHWLEKIN